MDHRIDVFKAFGLKPGSAYVLRNAGGSAVEALRSIVVSQQFLDTDRIMVVKHTDCGMQGLQNERVWDKLRVAHNGVEDRTHYHGFGELGEEVARDIMFLNASPLISERSKRNIIRGCVYHVKTGTLVQVVPPTVSELRSE